jgi:hypothetical protein
MTCIGCEKVWNEKLQTHVFHGITLALKGPLLGIYTLLKWRSMETVKQLTQAYSITPWRKQLRVIGLFLMGLVMASSVAVVYLGVSARTVAVGSQIQSMMDDIERMRRSNADLETTLAFLTSNSVMEARAREMGFRPARADELVYIEVPGYVSRREAVLAPPPGLQSVETTPFSPDYSESLLDWLRANALRQGLLGEVQP